MNELHGTQLLDATAERIISRYLQDNGHMGVTVNDMSGAAVRADNVDITYVDASGRRGIKVKCDPYIGTDASRSSDRARSFYRPDAQVYAFETVASTRQPGWLFSSAADYLYYYYLAIDQTDGEVGALFKESDSIFFSTLRVAVDELHIIPMQGLREWFEPRQESYPTRPVVRDGAAAWYRLVPRSDVLAGVPELRAIGSIFATLSR